MNEFLPAVQEIGFPFRICLRKIHWAIFEIEWGLRSLRKEESSFLNVSAEGLHGILELR